MQIDKRQRIIGKPSLSTTKEETEEMNMKPLKRKTNGIPEQPKAKKTHSFLRNKAFTLIELLVVIAITAIIIRKSDRTRKK